MGGRAPRYRLSADHFQTVKRLPAPDWAQKMLCLIVPNQGEQHPRRPQGESVGTGEKAGRKVSSMGGRAPGYRLSPDHFQKFKRMPAPDWAQKMLCMIVPNRKTHLLSSFLVFVHEGYCLDHGLFGSCTREMHAVRKLSV